MQCVEHGEGVLLYILNSSNYILPYWRTHGCYIFVKGTAVKEQRDGSHVPCIFVYNVSIIKKTERCQRPVSSNIHAA